MKKFLFRVALFISLSISLTALIVVSLNYTVQRDGFYNVDENVKYIVVGDSHPECAFNDSLIDNFKNFGQSGECYFYTYLKTKKILEYNPNIETVFVEFNNGQIIENIDPIIWDDKHITSKYPKYVFAMDMEDYSLLARNNFSGLMNVQSLSILKNYSIISNENRTMHHLDWGRYKRLTNNGQAVLSKSKDKAMILDTTVVKHATDNIIYLKKLISVCKESNVNVVFVRSPVHNKYAGRLNEITFRYLYKKHFNEIPFMDFENFEIEDSEYADFHHLNFLGANKFSIFFNEELERIN